MAIGRCKSLSKSDIFQPTPVDLLQMPHEVDPKIGSQQQVLGIRALLGWRLASFAEQVERSSREPREVAEPRCLTRGDVAWHAGPNPVRGASGSPAARRAADHDVGVRGQQVRSPHRRLGASEPVAILAREPQAHRLARAAYETEAMPREVPRVASLLRQAREQPQHAEELRAPTGIGGF